MIKLLIDKYTVIIGCSMFFFVFYNILSVVFGLCSKSSKADQNPVDEFEVKEEWKDFL